MKYLGFEFAGNTVQNWLLGAAIAVGVFVSLRVVQAIIVKRLDALARRTRTEWDDTAVAALRKTHAVFFVIVSLYTAGAFFVPTGAIRGALSAAVVLAVIVQGGVWANAAVAV